MTKSKLKPASAFMDEVINMNIKIMDQPIKLSNERPGFLSQTNGVWIRGCGAAIARAIGGGCLVALLNIVPALAQEANFSSVTLAPGFAPAQGALRGRTVGQSSLPAIVANRDRAGNLCLGYAASTPDHVLTLQGSFARLNLQVDSGGNDTTLVIQGPGNVVRCGSDTGRSRDASLQDTDWAAGTYRVWVGSAELGARFNYTLTVRE